MDGLINRVKSYAGLVKIAVLEAKQGTVASVYRYFPDVVPSVWSVVGPVLLEGVPPRSQVQSMLSASRFVQPLTSTHVTPQLVLQELKFSKFSQAGNIEIGQLLLIIIVLEQIPLLQTSSVQGSPSSQSIGILLQTPLIQVSIVQGLLSLQSALLAQAQTDELLARKDLGETMVEATDRVD